MLKIRSAAGKSLLRLEQPICWRQERRWLATAIMVLLSLDLAAVLLLLGAQVIAEYERLAARTAPEPPEPLQLTG